MMTAPLLLLLSCTNTPEPAADGVSEQVIATIGDDYTLPFSRLRQFHQDHEFGARYPDSEYRGYEEAMEYLITRRLKQIDFFESGMYQNPGLQRQVARLVSEELEQAYFREKHLSDYINDEAISEYYQGMQKEFFFRQIELPKSSRSADARGQAEQTISEILRAYEEGESFRRLMLQYDADSSVVTQTLRGDEDRSSPLFKQLYSLGEDDIKVVETATAFLIVKIDRVEPVEAPAPEQVRSEIVEALREIHLPRALEAFEEEKQQLINDDEIDWNEAALARLSALTQENSPSFFEENTYRQIVEDEIRRDENRVVLSYGAAGENGRARVTYSDYIRLLDEVLIPETSRGLSAEEYKAFLTEAMQRDLITGKAREMGLDQDLMKPDQASTELLDSALRLYDQTAIRDNIPEATPARLRSFYEAHKDSIFARPAKARILVKQYDTADDARRAWERFEAGTAFEDLASGYAVRSFVADSNGNITSFMSRETPYLGEIAFNMEEGEVRGPVEYEHAENGRQHVIVKSDRREDAYTPAFSELSDSRLERLFQTYHERRLARRLRNELWEKYPVSVHEDHLNQQLSAR